MDPITAFPFRLGEGFASQETIALAHGAFTGLARIAALDDR